MKYFSKSKRQSFHSDEQALLKDKLFFIYCNQLRQTRFPEGTTAVSVVALFHLFSPCYCLHSCGTFLSLLPSHSIRSVPPFAFLCWPNHEGLSGMPVNPPAVSLACIVYNPLCLWFPWVCLCMFTLTFFFYFLFHWIVSKCQAFDRLRRKNIKNVAKK